MKRKIFAIGIIGLLVMSGIVTMISSQTTAWSNKEDDIEFLSISVTKTSSGLQVDMYTTPYEYSGVGDLTIRNKTHELVYQQVIDIMYGGTTVAIPYNLFIIDNGNYTVEVAVSDKNDYEKIELIGVIEEIATVDAHAILDGMQPKIYIGVWTIPSVPFAASCNVTITKLDMGTEIYTNEPFSYNNSTQMFSGSLPYNQSGGYKIKIQVMNNLKTQTCVEKIINNTIINLVPIITEYPPQKTTIYNTYLSNGTQISGTQANESHGWTRFVRSDLADEKSYEITYNVKDYDDNLSDLIVTWDVGYNKSQGQSVNNPISENGTNDTIGGVGVFDAWYQYPIKNCSYKINLGISDRYSQTIATCEVTVVAEHMPTKVVLSAPTEISKNSMKLTWTQNNDTNFANYTIYQSTTSGDLGTPVHTITFQSTTSYTVTDLLASTTYYFTVRVYDTSGLWNDSNQVNATTLAINLPPTAVLLYESTGITTNSMLLSWSQNNDSDFANYTIYQSTTPDVLGNAIKVITTNTTTSWTVTELSPNTTYYFTLRVYDIGSLYNDSTQVSATTLVETKKSTKTSETSWSYILIPIIIIVVLAGVGLGVKRMKKGKTTTVRCLKCGETIKVTSAERPLSIVCPKCGAGGTIGKLRKEQKILPEKQVVEIPTITLRCPKCRETFKVEVKQKPFNIKCPHCGKEGTLK